MCLPVCPASGAAFGLGRLFVAFGVGAGILSDSGARNVARAPEMTPRVLEERSRKAKLTIGNSLNLIADSEKLRHSLAPNVSWRKQGSKLISGNLALGLRGVRAESPFFRKSTHDTGFGQKTFGASTDRRLGRLPEWEPPDVAFCAACRRASRGVRKKLTRNLFCREQYWTSVSST